MTISKKKRFCSVLVCLILLIFAAAGCGAPGKETSAGESESSLIVDSESAEVSEEQTAQTPETEQAHAETEDPELLPEGEEARIESILEGMSLEDKVAQLFVVTPEKLTGSDLVVQAGEMTQEAINTLPVAGLCYMAPNLESPEQTIQMLANVQQYSQERIGLPMFTCVDEEGGTVARVANNPAFDVPWVGNMSDVGASGDTEIAYEDGVTIGTYLGELGFNVDFAPVADVLGYEWYELLMYRSFGTDAGLVSDMAAALRRGLEDTGVQAVYKHFPGHGAASGDSHEGYVQVEKTMEELRDWDLVPFQSAIDNGLGWIMVGHITLPNASEDGLPASLSEEVVTDLLRGEMGYNGIVITDAMNMGAIAENYSSADASVLALQAGVDLLLEPVDLDLAYQGVLQAVRDERLSQERIDESLRRILHAKLALPQMVSP